MKILKYGLNIGLSVSGNSSNHNPQSTEAGIKSGIFC